MADAPEVRPPPAPGLVAPGLLVSRFGPAIAPLNALVLIGLDLTLRDVIHDRIGASWGMLAVILAGGLISYALNAGPIAVASTVAFVLAAGTDTAIYRALGDRARLVRVNGSNVVAGANRPRLAAWAQGEQPTLWRPS
jgi:hypothetical protein